MLIFDDQWRTPDHAHNMSTNLYGSQVHIGL